MPIQQTYKYNFYSLLEKQNRKIKSRDNSFLFLLSAYSLQSNNQTISQLIISF